MMVVSVLLLVALVVGGMLVLTGILCGVGPFRLTRDEVRTRVRELRPYVAILAFIYLFNRSTHSIGQRLSAQFGLYITDELYAIEGHFVVALQEAIPYRFATFFSFIYLFGFSFVLVFPVAAYFTLPTQRYLKELFVAYTVNYGAGAVCYLIFIAYGPRKIIPDVREPLFELYPEVVALTGAINSSTNVFPSLHVSLTVTATLLAWRTRSEYPLWVWIASLCTAGIVVSTMYLGIHWLLDVLFGIVLAVSSVGVALRLVDPGSDDGEIGSDADGVTSQRRP